MNDPVDDALKHSGIDPTPAFEAELEERLVGAYENQPMSTAAVRQTHDDATRRNIVVSVIVAVLIAAAIVGVLAFRDDSPDEPVVTTPTGARLPSVTVEPSTTAASVRTTAAPTTTADIASHVVATVDLTAAATRLEPKLFASFPITPPGDLYPTASATPAPGDRVAVLDDVSGVVRFIDGVTRMQLTQYPTDIPTIGNPSFSGGYFFVGPDDVIYVNDADGALVAYARRGDRYGEVARVPNAVGDAALVLGRTGVSVLGADAAVMPYVGTDGQPSGAIVDADRLTVTADAKDVYTLQRGDSRWTITYVFPPDTGLAPSGTCVLCPSAQLGPGKTAVMVIKSPTTDGDLQTKLTVLGEQVTTFDTDWNYIGTLDDQMLFGRLDQDSIDIGTVQP